MSDEKKRQLRTYLEQGLGIEESAKYAGIELNEAIQLVVEMRVTRAYDDDILRATAKEAAVVGMKALKALALDAPADVAQKAASELVKFSLQARKMMIEDRPEEKKTTVRDLWSFAKGDK